MSRSHLFFAHLLCCAAALLWAPEAHAADDPKPLPVQTDKLHPLTFANFLVRLDDSSGLGTTHERFVFDVLDTLRKHGYPAVGGENILFGQNRADAARFVLGGTIREGNCKVVSQKTWCFLGIEWQLFDREREYVSYEVMTRWKRERPAHEEDEGAMWPKLIAGALRQLMSREAFVAALTKRPGEEVVEEEAHYEPAELATCPSVPTTMPKDSERVIGATVLISSGNSIGSGVLVSPDGYVLTAAHVVQSLKSRGRLRDGREADLALVRYSTKFDVALLKLDLTNTPCLPLQLGLPQVGSETWAVGSPAGKEFSFSVSRGIISGVRLVNGAQFLQTDASVNPGNSGGPLVNERGEAIAVVSWKLVKQELEGMAFGVPSRAALDRLALNLAAATDTAKLAPLEGREYAEERPKTFTDKADPRIDLDPKGDIARARFRATPGWVHGMRIAALGTAIAGLTIAGTSWLMYDERTSTRDDYERLRLQNDIGWVAVGAGALTFGLSFLFRPDEEAIKKARIKETSASISPNGTVQLRVRY